MKELNKQNVPVTTRPERIIQFGEGNFLRAFVDWIIWNMNAKADFNSNVVVVQPIEKGMVDMLNKQDNLYHVNLQGLDKGKTVNSLEPIQISRHSSGWRNNRKYVLSSPIRPKPESLSIRPAGWRMLRQLPIPAN